MVTSVYVASKVPHPTAISSHEVMGQSFGDVFVKIYE